MLKAANRMLRRGQVRRDFSLAMDSADDQFTKIISVNQRDNIEPALKLAKEHGLDAKLYADCKIAVTGRREKVLQFQQLIFDSFFGEMFAPTEGVHVVKDLIKMSHDLMLDPGRGVGREVALAIQDLQSLHPVRPERMKRYKALREQLKAK